MAGRRTQSQRADPRAKAATARAGRLLRDLERVLLEPGAEALERKRALLDGLRRASLGSAASVLRLHEALCVLRAYPADEDLLRRVVRMLEGFARRADLRRARDELADTGVAGTDIRFPFFQPQAEWLARRYGPALTVDWDGWQGHGRLAGWLEACILESEVPALYDVPLSAREWVARLKAADESDGQFLVRLARSISRRPGVQRAMFDGLDVPFRLDGRAGGPARSLACHERAPAAWQTGPLRRRRPDLARAVREPPRSVRDCSRAEGRALIDLACEAMATRARDLDSFSYASADDVRMVDLGEGHALACIGLVPEQRIVLEGCYAFLMLKNGVPTGYCLASALYGSSDIAYNVFETFRAAEAAWVYGRILGTVAALFGSDTFCVVPYQLGHENEEGLSSGAWWFYQKLGFRPDDPGILRLMRRELAAMSRDRAHRSSRATLQQLVRKPVFWSAGRRRDDVIGRIPFERISLAVSDAISARFGSDRATARATLRDEAAALLGVDGRRGWRSWRPPERVAFERWAPILTQLRGLGSWSAAQRRELVAVVRAKGARRESDFIEAFGRHRRLQRALLTLA